MELFGISIAKYTKNTHVTCSDISKDALEIARKNCERLLKNENIEFIESDMFENINKKYDIIVSNPPYIKQKVIKEYSLKYEPQLALDGGLDGLKFYKIIIDEAYKYLNEEGIVVLEIGFDQREEVIDLIEKSGKYKDIYCKKDLNNLDRVLVFKRR